MKSLGANAAGLRLQRIRTSAQWVEPAAGSGFRNLAPIPPGLRDPRGQVSVSG